MEVMVEVKGKVLVEKWRTKLQEKTRNERWRKRSIGECTGKGKEKRVDERGKSGEKLSWC